MSLDFVLLGGTGDLAWRKLMPGLFQAFRHGSLPQETRIIGVARDDLSDAQYRALIHSRFDEVELAKRPSPEEFDRFAVLLHFLRMDLSRPDDYRRLAQLLRQRAADCVVMYLATAPSLFTVACELLAAAGLNTPNTRLVLEKPLGHDLASNRAVNETVRKGLSEKQIFRIDHYLGKPSVQNHALQLVCALAMEPPINAHADAIRDEKLKVLRSLKPWTAEAIGQHVIRGQYAAGSVSGETVPGYREEPGMKPDSTTETFVALRAEIANWRWATRPAPGDRARAAR